jgi:hypothetical protein
MRSLIGVGLLLVTTASAGGDAPPPALDPATAQRFAALALACVHREYPNKIAHVLNGDADVKPPRELTPAFYGCFDWHSAVHAHWLLARLARTYPQAELAASARAALERSLTPSNLAAEVRYLEGMGRATFERPYGLAWLLQLAGELAEWDDADARRWYAALKPLERAAVTRLTEWLPKLSHPIRTGEHDQTAFSFGLMVDTARATGNVALGELIRERFETFYARDRACPLDYEPSGQDFLSPCLAEADLARRVLAPTRFAAWLGAFLPQIPHDQEVAWLLPATVTDRADGKLAHLDGLNLSRAWMLEGIASGLPRDDPRIGALQSAAASHRATGLAAVTGEHYEGGHWLATFAVYLTTRRGLESR